MRTETMRSESVGSRRLPVADMRQASSFGARSLVLATPDEALRTSLAAELRSLRWTVYEATGAAETFVHLAEFPVEAVLIDSWLPDLEIREFLEELALIFPGLDVLTLDGADMGSAPARGPFRGELLHALRQAQRSQESEQPAGYDASGLDVADAPAAAYVQSLGQREVPPGAGFKPSGSALAGQEIFHQQNMREENALPPAMASGSAACGGSEGSSAALAPRSHASRPEGAWPAPESSVCCLKPEVAAAERLPSEGERGPFTGAAANAGPGAAASPQLVGATRVVDDPGGKDAACPVPALSEACLLVPELVGSDARVLEVRRRITLVAHRPTTVLVHGPTGSGKELVARALHRLSGRRQDRFVPINCAAIPEALIESELFGYARGAFTGAVQTRPGRIEAASGGTLFLDEIGELPLSAQSKLLRLLESGELQRVGENQVTHVEVRVIAATHRRLGAMAAEGSFRLDLLHRLSVFLIETPGLAGRTADLDALIAHTLDKLAREEAPKQLSREALSKLHAHNWPGNVRELEHTIERSWILAGAAPTIDAACVDFGEALL